jgi:tyrosine-protein kinase Etk/Wzc
MEPNRNSGNHNLLDDDTLDIKRYLSLFISNWYWFAIAFFFALTIAYGINRYSEKIYTESATLLINDDQSANIKSNVENVIPGGDIFKNHQNLKNEMGILKSFMLNYRVMKELIDFHVVYIGVGRRGIVETRMYNTCPFKVVYDSLEIQPNGIANKVTINILTDTTYSIEFIGENGSGEVKKIGERIRKQGFDFSLEPRVPGIRIYQDNNNIKRYNFYFTNPGSLANEYRGKLSVEPIDKEASIVTLSISGYVKEQEIDYLNMLMKVYLEYGLDNKNQTADSTIRFIDRQLNKISDSLTKAENRLKDFRLSNRFIDLSREGVQLQNKLERFEIEKSTFELQLRYYNYLSEYLSIENAGSSIISPSVMGITDQVLIRLVNELSSLQREREKIGLNIVSDQPTSEFMDKQVKESREALKENVRNGIAGLTLSISESENKISSVRKDIDRLPITEKALIGIQRNYDLNNTVYTYLLEKRAESGIAKASNIPDNRTIDSASFYRSGQIKPKTKYNYMIAIMLGLIFPIVAIALIDYLNDKVIDKRDIEKKTKVPVIGYISHSDGKNEIPVIEKPGSSLAE